jgi:hypothetical protein
MLSTPRCYIRNTHTRRTPRRRPWEFVASVLRSSVGRGLRKTAGRKRVGFASIAAVQPLHCHEMPCHPNLESCLHAYIDRCGLVTD